MFTRPIQPSTFRVTNPWCPRDFTVITRWISALHPNQLIAAERAARPGVGICFFELHQRLGLEAKLGHVKTQVFFVDFSPSDAFASNPYRGGPGAIRNGHRSFPRFAVAQ